MRSLLLALSLSLRGLPARPYEVATLIASAFAMAAIMLAFLGMKSGLDRTLANAGSDQLLVILGNGAETEVTSALALSETNRIATAARMSTPDDLIISPEVYTNIRIAGANGRAQIIAIRGVTPAAFDVRRNFRIIAGRRFDPGRRELIAGRELAARLPWIDVGREIMIGDVAWEVVGLFGADETALESELIGGATLIQDAFRRQGVFQSVRVRKGNAGDVQDVIDSLPGNLGGSASPKIFRETEYYGAQIADINNFIDYVAIPSIIILFLATLASSINSLYVINKSFRNLNAIMCSLGFSKAVMSLSIFLTSNIVNFIGIFIGIIFALTMLDDYESSMMNFSSFSEIFFTIEINARTILLAMVVPALSSVIGSLPAAIDIMAHPIARLLRAS